LALGETFRRFGHPTVIGEIFAEYIARPVDSRHLETAGFRVALPASSNAASGKSRLVGQVFLLLVAGTEVNLATLIQECRVVAFKSLIGIAVPFTVGLVLGLNLPDTYLIDPERRLLFSFFIARSYRSPRSRWSPRY
jgi:Kef-type K+ transport system membrane component KefB